MEQKGIEGIICPACSTPIEEDALSDKLVCPHCQKNLKLKKYLAFLEFLMMQGIVTNIDFFDETLYGDEIKKADEADELKDETDPNEYENKQQKFEQYEDDMEVKETGEVEEVATSPWDSVDDDWREFNRKQREIDEKANKDK